MRTMVAKRAPKKRGVFTGLFASSDWGPHGVGGAQPGAERL
jgi:hypothetical protein